MDISNKFSKDFIEKFKYDAMFNAIINNLKCDNNPYKIIEHLLIDRKSQIEQIDYLVKHKSPSVIVPIESLDDMDLCDKGLFRKLTGL